MKKHLSLFVVAALFSIAWGHAEDAGIAERNLRIASESRDGVNGERPAQVLSKRLGACLVPLENPTLENAKEAVTLLESLADTQKESDRQVTEKVAEVVKRMFRAEFELTFASNNLGPAEQGARAQEQKAKAWLIPNGFGHNSPTNYRAGMQEAQRIRDSAIQAAKEARLRLGGAMRDTIVQLDKIEALGLPEVYRSLKGAMDAVAARALKIRQPGEMTVEQLGRTLLAIGIIAIAIEGLRGSSSSSSEDPQAKWKQDMQKGLEHQAAQTRNYQDENRMANSAGRPLPHPGYGY